MKTGSIVFIVLLSVLIWGIFLLNGWVKEAVIFGCNIFNSWIDPQITWNEKATTIKYGKFSYRLLYDISIPENITNIESNAFKGNKLMRITIGSNVSLGENAFGFDFEDFYYDNEMRGGTYTRDYYKSTDWIAWDENFGYKKNIDNNITITGYKGSFGELTIPNEINGKKVTIIGNNAFSDKRLLKVIIPASVTYIGEGAFRDNLLSVVAIPENVSRIEDYAFYRNQLTGITIGRNVNFIGKNSFGQNKLTGIFIPNSVKNISVHAFSGNQIIRVNIGEGVSLGTDNSSTGILGSNTGFNSAYSNNKNRSGIYTRPNTNTTTWTRTPR